ncbi:hypothetical protein KC968_00285 [Candidatus Saccharibacteria bacterium]|nr:hypothetical protein [Candidatus Saccharibacteria bacterium]
MTTKKRVPKRKNALLLDGGRGLIGVVLAYAFASRAFSTGSFLQYGVAILFLVLGVKLLVRAHKSYGSSN